MRIAILDVHYPASGARAACVLAESWQSAVPLSAHVVNIEAVADYEPGQFYRRELPCLMAVLERLPALPDVVVVDAYVWLSGEGREGLGAYLHEALGWRVPVVGIAKTAFAELAGSKVAAEVCRGESKRPLFVTAAGMDLSTAVESVRAMAGPYRVPDLVKLADHLSRSGALG
jgi:deoxyribonuclease V